MEKEKTNGKLTFPTICTIKLPSMFSKRAIFSELHSTFIADRMISNRFLIRFQEVDSTIVAMVQLYSQFRSCCLKDISVSHI